VPRRARLCKCRTLAFGPWATFAQLWVTISHMLTVVSGSVCLLLANAIIFQSSCTLPSRAMLTVRCLVKAGIKREFQISQDPLLGWVCYQRMFCGSVDTACGWPSIKQANSLGGGRTIATCTDRHTHRCTDRITDGTSGMHIASFTYVGRQRHKMLHLAIMCGRADSKDYS